MQITAAVMREAGAGYSLESVELDDPGPTEVLVDVHAAGICHTDISVSSQVLPLPLPLVLGHEGAGVVAAVGSAVSKVSPGDRVALTFNSCGSCGPCSQDHPAYCADFMMRNLSGVRPDGTPTIHDHAGTSVGAAFFGQSSFATHALASERNVVLLPDDADFTIAGPLGCGIQTGAGTVINRLKPRPGSSFAVFGSGAVGLAALMAAKYAGCETIIAVDIKAGRLALATELGATHTIDATAQTDLPAAVRAIIASGVDHAVDTTGSATVAQQAVLSLASMGSFAVLGLGAVGTALTLDMTMLMTIGATIMGVTEGDSDPDRFLPFLYGLWADGRFPVDRLIRTYDFADIEVASQDAASGVTVKPVLVMPGRPPA